MDNQGEILNYDEQHRPRPIVRVCISTKKSLEKAKRNSEYIREESLIEREYTITCALVDISSTLVDNKFHMALQRNANISHISFINTSQQKNRLGPEELATH